MSQPYGWDADALVMNPWPMKLPPGFKGAGERIELHVSEAFFARLQEASAIDPSGAAMKELIRAQLGNEMTAELPHTVKVVTEKRQTHPAIPYLRTVEDIAVAR